MAYYFYLGKDILLPVAPRKLQMKVKNANKTYTMVNEGEINMLKVPGLTDFEFDALLPNVKYPFAVYKNGDFHRAYWYLKKLEAMKTKKKKFQFIVSRKLPNGTVLFNTDITCSLEDYTVKEDAKDNGMDVVVTIKLKQYREYSTKTCKVKKKKKKKKKKVVKKKTRATTKNTANAQTYVVKKGDCLWAIARKFYGDGSKYMTIYNANKKLLGKRSPNLIYAGDKLTIPALK